MENALTPGSDAEGPASLDVTVIVCTFNRCCTLADTLASITDSEMPESIDWEVLVVDNDSTDETRQVVEDFCRRYPQRFRYLLESRHGKSHALNTAVTSASGQVLVFVDDDVLVQRQWLYNLTAGLYRGEWAGSGGRVLPFEGFVPPYWLSPRNLGALYGHFDLGDQPGELTCAPYGTNMAFRRAMFEKYGSFRTDLGPSRNSDVPRKNEDTEFGRRLIKAGERLRYEPMAVVYHPVLVERLTKRYFCDWWFDFGRATVRELGAPPNLYGIPGEYIEVLRYAVRIAKSTTRWVFSARSQKRLWYQCQTWRWAGHIAELRRFCRKKPPADITNEEQRIDPLHSPGCGHV